MSRTSPSRGFRVVTSMLVILGLASGGLYVVRGEEVFTDSAESARDWVLRTKARTIGDGSPTLAVPDTATLNAELDQVPLVSVEPIPQKTVEDFDTFVRDRVISNGGVWPESAPFIGGTSDSFWSVVGARYGMVAPEEAEVVRGTEVLLEQAGVDLHAVVWDEIANPTGEKPLYRWHYRVGDMDLPLMGGTVSHGDRLMALAFDAMRFNITGAWDRDDLLTIDEAFDNFRHLDYEAVVWDAFSYDWPLDEATFTSATLTQACLFTESETTSCGARMTEGGTYALTPVWVLHDPSTVKPLILPAVRDLNAWVSIANAKPWADSGVNVPAANGDEVTDAALREELVGSEDSTDQDVRPVVDLRPSMVKQLLDVRSPYFSLDPMDPGYLPVNGPSPAPATWRLRARVKKADSLGVAPKSGSIDIEAARSLILDTLDRFGVNIKRVRFVDDPSLRPAAAGVVLRWVYKGSSRRVEGDLAMPEVDGIANVSADTFFREAPNTWLLMDFDVTQPDLVSR